MEILAGAVEAGLNNIALAILLFPVVLRLVALTE